MSQKVLWIQTAFLGDLILSIPSLYLIKKNNPKTEVHLLCRTGIGGLLKDLQVVDQVFEIQKGQADSYRRIEQDLKLHTYDIIYCPHKSVRTVWLLKNLNAKKKVGFTSWWNFWAFDRRFEFLSSYPDVLRQIYLLQDEYPSILPAIQSFDVQRHLSCQRSGIPSEPISKVKETVSMPTSLPWDSWQEVERLGFRSDKSYVCLFPGSVWATKQWGKSKYQELVAKLSKNLTVVILGAKNEFDFANEVIGESQNCVNLCGKTEFKQTLSLLKHARQVVTNDSGGQHLASIVSAPTITVFGPTIPEFGYSPWNSQVKVAEPSVALSCRPCGSHGHKKCPIGTHECMKSISSDSIYSLLD